MRKAREVVTEALKSVSEFNNRVFFVDHPANQGYPCVVYTQTGYRPLELISKRGVPFAQYFTVDVRTVKPDEAEDLSEKVLKALQKTGKLEEKISLSFEYDNADAATDTVRDQFGIYRAVSVYLIRGK